MSQTEEDEEEKQKQFNSARKAQSKELKDYQRDIITTEAASRNRAWQRRRHSATDRHDQGDRVETCRVGRSGGSVYSMMQTGERKGKRQDGRVDEEKK